MNSNEAILWGTFTAMKELTKSLCWDLVSINKDTINGVGAAIYRKPTSNECYEKRSQSNPPLCGNSDDPNAAWYLLSLTSFFLSYICIFFKFNEEIGTLNFRTFDLVVKNLSGSNHKVLFMA